MGVIKDVRMELMGHSRNEDTNDLYSQIELPTLREAIAKLEAWTNLHREALAAPPEQPEILASATSQPATLLQ